MKWFNNPETLEDLKKQYKKLAFQNHPDRGGKTSDRIGYRIHVLVKLQDLTLYKNTPHYFALLSLRGDIMGAYYNLFRVQ